MVRKTITRYLYSGWVSSRTLWGFFKKRDVSKFWKKVYEQRNAIYKSAKIGDYYITDDKYRELIRFSVLPGDFIVSCSGTIGKIFEPVFTAENAEWARDFAARQGKFSQAYFVYGKKI